jgi:hypothetical protein
MFAAHACAKLFSLMKRMKAHERSWLTDTHLSSIMKVISAQDLKPKTHTLAANIRWQFLGKTKGKFSYFKNSLFVL